MFVLFKDILNDVYQFSHTAWKYDSISVLVVPFFAKLTCFYLNSFSTND